MKTACAWTLALVLVFTLFPVPAFAQLPDFDKIERMLSLQIGGFVGTTTYNDYQNWAVVELGFKRDHLSLFDQYDFSVSNLREGYCKYTQVDTTEIGGEWSYSFRAGKFLSSVFDSLPGQKSNPATRGLGALNIFTPQPVGMRADLNWKRGWISLAHTRGQRFIATISNGILYLSLEKKTGAIVVRPTHFSKWVNLTGALASDKNGPSWSLQNFFELPKKVRWYTQADYARKSDRVFWLTGLALAYAKNSHLKLFYDSHLESAVGEVTFAF